MARVYFLTMLVLALLVTGSAGPLHAAQAVTGPVTVKLHDLEVIDQDGKRGRFKSDFIGDRLVAVTFTYTTCTTICPILDSVFASLQGKLGNRLGKDVAMLTVSIDPVTDIPPRLKAHARKLNARPGWTFLTGRKPDVDRILVGLDMYTPDILNHAPSVLVGDGRTGVWRRLYGFPSADKILAALAEVERGRR